MHDRLRFAEVYGRLADDELARIALSGNLVPDAEEALTVELQKRGIADLSQYKHTLEAAAGASSVGSDVEGQSGLKQAPGDRMFVLAAWVLAVCIPLASS
jgi:hypothetical protein